MILMKDKKGFTLTELIGVIVLLGIIALIAVPIVNRTIKNSKEKAYDSQVEEIISSAKKWGVENNSKIDTEGRTTFLTVGNLIEDGYLEDDAILDPRDNTSLESSCVKIKYDNFDKEYLYEFGEKCDILAANSDTAAYAIFLEEDSSLIFIRSQIEPKIGEKYEGKMITKVYSNFEEMVYTNSNEVPWNTDEIQIKKIVFADEVKPNSTAYWFANVVSCEYLDMINLNGINNTNTSEMFAYFGRHNGLEYAKIFGLSDFDMSNVSDASFMFRYAMLPFNLENDLQKWDVSNLVNANGMFWYAGTNSDKAFILDLSKWDVSNVTNMQNMFMSAGRYSKEIRLGDLSNWNTSNVENMAFTFSNLCYSVEHCKVIDVIGDINKWNVSNVRDMNHMFSSAGYTSNTFELLSLDQWNLNNLETTYRMFYDACRDTTSCTIGDLSNWNTSNIENMQQMFFGTAQNSTEFKISGLEGWNTSNVVDMNGMFWNMGINASYYFDLSSWDVSKVTSYNYFNSGSSTKIKPPVWKN